MHKLVFITLSCLFQGYHFTIREDTINEYQPILINKTANLTTEYKLANTEYTFIINLIKNDTWTAVSTMNTQISNLKSTIISAKTASAKKPKVLECLKPQETAAGQLSTTPINSTCWVDVTYPDLVGAKNALQILAKIPNATISACGTLDPLPSQDELFVSCITDKILDLDEEIVILKNAFLGVKTETINKSVQCLADQSALIVDKINEINFQVSLCMALG